MQRLQAGSRGKFIPAAQQKGDRTALGQRPGFESDALGGVLGHLTLVKFLNLSGFQYSHL